MSTGFDNYVAARAPALIRFAWALTGDWHLAEDLTQDALVAAHRRWRRIQRLEHPDAYVRRIILNRYLSHKRLRRNREVPDNTAMAAAASSAGFDLEERDRLITALGQLPRVQRAVMVLRYYEDLDDRRIADHLNCTQSSVRTHAERGKKALASLLNQPVDHRYTGRRND